MLTFIHHHYILGLFFCLCCLDSIYIFIIEQNTTVVERTTHYHIIHIFIGHKVQLTNTEIAKPVVALNPQLFQHMNFQKEEDYYKVYMHINRNVLVEYQNMKKLSKSVKRDQRLSEFTWKVYKPLSTNAERNQD